MIVRKLLMNTLIAFLLFPVVLSVRYWPNIFQGIYRVEDAFYDSFWDFYKVILHEGLYPFSSIIFLFIILLPFQYIKDYFFEKKRRPLTFFSKCLVFCMLFGMCYILITGRYFGYMVKYKPFLLYMPILVVGIFFPLILYFTVDRYVERKQDIENEKV